MQPARAESKAYIELVHMLECHPAQKNATITIESFLFPFLIHSDPSLSRDVCTHLPAVLWHYVLKPPLNPMMHSFVHTVVYIVMDVT